MKATRRMALAAAIGGLLLAGCAAGGRLIEPGAYHGDALSITVTRPWSDVTFLLLPRPENVRLLSIDGPNLNRLYVAGLTSGQSLVRPADRDTPRPTYRPDMSDTELVEFVIDCIAQEFQAPEASGLRPQNMGSVAGVRFEISTRTSYGLNISGTALVARHGERLNVLLYLAPSEHYYGALLPEVEAIFASAAAR